VEQPFTWPGQDPHGGHGHHGHGAPPDDTTDIGVMEEVMKIMRDALLGASPAATLAVAATVRGPARRAFRELLLGAVLPDELR
jgi:hypothetical protein